MGTINPGPAPTPPSAAFDGSYRSSIRITGGSASAQGQGWCQTPGQPVINVRDGEFSYALPHPNVPGGPTPVFQAAMAPDGSFSGQHVEGDVFVKSQFENGGGIANPVAYYWHQGSLQQLTSGALCTSSQHSGRAWSPGM